MTECIPDFHVCTIFPVYIDRFSPNFCHWCILGHRWPDYVFGSKGQSSRSHHRGEGAQHSMLLSSATFSSFGLDLDLVTSVWDTVQPEAYLSCMCACMCVCNHILWTEYLQKYVTFFTEPENRVYRTEYMCIKMKQWSMAPGSALSSKLATQGLDLELETYALLQDMWFSLTVLYLLLDLTPVKCLYTCDL